MTITQIRKKYGGMEITRLSTGELVFKVDNSHVRLVRLEKLIKDKDYSDHDLGVLEVPIVCVSDDTNDLFGNRLEENKRWISNKNLINFLENKAIELDKVEKQKTNNSRVLMYKTDREFVFMDGVNDITWTFSFDFPDLETLKVHESFFGSKIDEEIKNNVIPMPDEYAYTFIKNYDKKNNRLTIYNILMQLYGVSEEDLDKIYHRNLNSLRILKKAIKETKKKCNNSTYYINKLDKLDDIHFYNLYNSINHYLNDWQWSEERIIKYFVTRKIPNSIKTNIGKPMIDIFGECHPTKYSLLHEFYNSSKEDEELMDKIIEIYPEEKDIDLAYYHFIENRK